MRVENVPPVNVTPLLQTVREVSDRQDSFGQEKGDVAVVFVFPVVTKRPVTIAR